MKTTRRANVTRAQEGQLKLSDERQSLKHKQNWRKLLLLGIQPGDKLAKPPFFVAYSRLCRHCRNLAEGACRLLRFHFRPCRYFLGHVSCRNLPWQDLLLGGTRLVRWTIENVAPELPYWVAEKTRAPVTERAYLKLKTQKLNARQSENF